MTCDIHEFETALRELVTRYELYFNGSEKRAPLELLMRVEQMARSVQPARIANTATRFRFTSAVARLSSYRELWARNQRLMDEGRRPARQGGCAEDPIDRAWRELDRQCRAAGIATPTLERVRQALGERLAEAARAGGAPPRVTVSVVDGRAKIRIVKGEP